MCSRLGLKGGPFSIEDKIASSPPLRSAALESRDAIELLTDKWRISVLHLLRHGALRPHELQNAIEEISPKMLTQTLRGMERDGLLTRKVHPVAPPHVEYELTGMALSLLSPLQTLCHWAKDHVAERDAARARFDLAAAQKPTRTSK
jgi:DNA-binding HxlR family transcriptional regulator